MDVNPRFVGLRQQRSIDREIGETVPTKYTVDGVGMMLSKRMSTPSEVLLEGVDFRAAYFYRQRNKYALLVWMEATYTTDLICKHHATFSLHDQRQSIEFFKMNKPHHRLAYFSD
jgi:hypothetical protein